MIAHSIYKVDTVNDCHMLASGLPEKNEDKHATEIADFALDVLVRKKLIGAKQPLQFTLLDGGNRENLTI